MDRYFRAKPIPRHYRGDIEAVFLDVGRAVDVDDVTGLSAALALKAPIASPALTGTPTAPTAAPGTNTTQIATTAFVEEAVAGAGGGGGGSPILGWMF